MKAIFKKEIRSYFCSPIGSVLTMRSIAEEKNAKTDQLLLTSPVSVTSIVLGKLFAAICVFLIAMALTVMYPVILLSFSKPDWGKIIGNYVGFILMGSAFVSIGIYISSLTENQIIAAVSTFGVLMIIFLSESFSNLIGIKFVKEIIQLISLPKRFTEFSNGIVDIKSVMYYLSVVAIFVSLTVIHIEKKRWSK